MRLYVRGKQFASAIALAFSVNFASMVMAESKAWAQEQPIWFNCLTREIFTPEKRAWCDRWMALQRVDLIVPNGVTDDAEMITVSLENGRYRQQNGQLYVELVNERGWLTFGDLNGDGKADAATFFGVAADPEGRSIATYLTVVMDVEGEAQALTPVRMGERILLNGPIAIENNSLKVPFLTQTEAIDRTFMVSGTALVECGAR